VRADYLVLAADWDAKHSSPPELMGQLFHLFESPNRFGLPPFYTLHVWAWMDNPNGTFVKLEPGRVVRRVQTTNPVARSIVTTVSGSGGLGQARPWENRPRSKCTAKCRTLGTA